MTSLKPYLIRTLYEWIIDNNMTPFLLVSSKHPKAILPEDFIENDQIVLNIRPEAIQNLYLGDKTVEFDARFSGQSLHVIAPTSAVLAVYAKENNKGMFFDPNDESEDDQPPPQKESTPPTKRPQLKIVK
jgi:stringent starvation protein B